MGMRTKTEMLEFGVAYAKKCMELEEKLELDLWLWDSELRFENLAIKLATLSDCENPQEASEYVHEADNNLTELTDNQYIDGAILCEGYVYEALYYYQGFGDVSTFGKDKTKLLDKELKNVLYQYGFHMDLSRGGTILLQCRESLEKEMQENGWKAY